MKYIYIHICCINNWESIVTRLINKTKESGLYDEVLEIRCGILGNPFPSTIFYDPKINIIYHSTDLTIGESATLNLMREHSKVMNPETTILYLHSKGVKYNGENQCINDWTDYMTYFVVECWQDCQIGLNLYDTIGVNLIDEISVDAIDNINEKIQWHYSGNFWWSKSSYINTLDECHSGIYHAPEMWICSKTEKRGSLFQSNKHHYLEEFPENNYRVLKNSENVI
jgi:hypothetical protein